jgi:Relaxase/Mobilisation nuclease domain.
MVKVLSRGDQTLRAVRRHFDYLSRGGELEIETDDGSLQGKGVEKRLLEDWDLDLDDHRRRSELTAANGRKPPKLVHKLMFSMPLGTPPEKVLAAVRDFAREEFALKHRYAMVLHTDEPHPHVHMVVKAVSEQGERLNIRKETLRQWREEFARHLRAHGVAANATQRYVRGETQPRKSDGIYRAMLRGSSTHMHDRVRAVADELRKGSKTEPAKVGLLETRTLVETGWRVVRRLLATTGHQNLATDVDQFVGKMLPPLTEKEWFAEQLRQHRWPERAQTPNVTR